MSSFVKGRSQYFLPQSEGERQTPHDITYTSDLKQGTCEPVHKAETDSQTENGHGCQGSEEGRVGSLGLTDTDCYIQDGETKKALLCNPENYVNVSNHSGKEYEKDYVYMQVNESAMQLKLTRHCKSTIVFLKIAIH